MIRDFAQAFLCTLETHTRSPYTDIPELISVEEIEALLILTIAKFEKTQCTESYLRRSYPALPVAIQKAGANLAPETTAPMTVNGSATQTAGSACPSINPLPKLRAVPTKERKR